MNRTHAITVRPAKRTELNDVSFLFRQVLKALPYYNNLAKRNEARKYAMNNLLSKQTKDRYSVLVAIDESGNLVGFCFNHFDDYTIWIDWFGVRDHDRKKGVGAKIMRTVCSTARKRGAHKIWCDTRSSNKPSKSLLQKLGFRNIVVIKKHWYKQDFIIWEKFV